MPKLLALLLCLRKLERKTGFLFSDFIPTSGWGSTNVQQWRFWRNAISSWEWNPKRWYKPHCSLSTRHTRTWSRSKTSISWVQVSTYFINFALLFRLGDFYAISTTPKVRYFSFIHPYGCLLDHVSFLSINISSCIVWRVIAIMRKRKMLQRYS